MSLQELSIGAQLVPQYKKRDQAINHCIHLSRVQGVLFIEQLVKYIYYCSL